MLAATFSESFGGVSERRSSARHVAVILIAKLSMATEQSICRIRNISEMGALIETTMRLTVGQTVSLELRSDLCMTGQIMWADVGRAGVRFDAPINVSRYLVRSESKIDRVKARAPRYRCSADSIIGVDNRCVPCKVNDIGLSGVRLSNLPHRALIRQGHLLKFVTEGLSSHNATVAWIDGGNAGIKFRHPLKYTELQEWLVDNPPEVAFDLAQLGRFSNRPLKTIPTAH